jgi:hypothetical protein
VVVALTLVWGAAVTAVLWQNLVTPARATPRPSLAGRLPAALEDGRVEELLLGPSEFIDSGAREKMEYDDVVYRRYSCKGAEFTVYVGYWARGRRPPSFIAAHTPDQCWTLVGMTREKRVSGYRLSAGETRLAPGEWRKFRDQSGLVYHVVYWHLVGQNFYDYSDQPDLDPGYARRAFAAVRDLVLWRDEQYFVRVVSPVPFDELAGSTGFQTVMRHLATLGLSAHPLSLAGAVR